MEDDVRPERGYPKIVSETEYENIVIEEVRIEKESIWYLQANVGGFQMAEKYFADVRPNINDITNFRLTLLDKTWPLLHPQK